MGDVLLAGCRAEPLGSYLKAIGLLRLVSEQRDPDATGHWVGDTFCLDSSLDADGLVDFLVDDYQPTPIVTPWNKGSGFAPGDEKTSKTAFAAAETIAASTDARLSNYRATIDTVRRAMGRSDWDSLEKEVRVALCRNLLPDEALAWLDAAIVLTADSRAFPPLLGTGGNDGRLDFGSNFMQRIAGMLRIGSKTRTEQQVRDLARSAIMGVGNPRLDQIAIGQFDPAAAGGPGSSASGSAESIANPWDFVLLFEGAVVFASGAARRLSTGVGGSSMPFSVAAVAAGHPSAAEESGRGEFWAPLWRQPTGGPELRRLVAEGRVEYRGRQARTALDVARALAALGVDRGIDEFVRYGFLERNGRSTFSVPVGRYHVPNKPNGAAAIMGQIDGWMAGARRAKNPPASATARIRRIDSLQFDLAAVGEPVVAQDLLCEVSSLERLASRSRNLREATLHPVNNLMALDWLPVLDDGSAELAVAASLASLRSPTDQHGWLRALLLDVEWTGRPAKVDGFGRRPLTDVLADCLVVLLATKKPKRTAGEHSGCFGPASAIWAGQAAVGAFANGELDDARIERLLGACLMLNWQSNQWRPSTASPTELPSRTWPAFALIKPCLHHRPLDHDGRSMRADASWIRLLAAGRPERTLEHALREVRLAGYQLAVHTPHALAAGVDNLRLAAACLIPQTDRAIHQLLERVVLPSDETTKEPQ